MFPPWLGVVARGKQRVPRCARATPRPLFNGNHPATTQSPRRYKTNKTFFVHTPERVYYLSDVKRAAVTWVDAIQQVLRSS